MAYLEDLELEGIQDAIEKKKQLERDTWLSERQAEILALYTLNSGNLGQIRTLSDVAHHLEISVNTVYTQWRHLKDKVRKSKNTVSATENLNL